MIKKHLCNTLLNELKQLEQNGSTVNQCSSRTETTKGENNRVRKGREKGAEGIQKKV